MFDTDGRPLHVSWHYTRSEMVADAVIHVLGLVLAVVGSVALVVLAILYAPPVQTGAVILYAAGLIGLLSVSAAYNMWPISPTKWLLRRFDHACIFILIAATYTPFMTRFPPGGPRTFLVCFVWGVAVFGAVVKLALPGRFDRLSIALCLMLGFSGGLTWEVVTATLSSTTIALIIAGGLTYGCGVIFHLWESMRFQNAVWHTFVLVASALYYVAILHGVVLA